MVTVDLEINLRYILSTAKLVNKLDVWDEREEQGGSLEFCLKQLMVIELGKAKEQVQGKSGFPVWT